MLAYKQQSGRMLPTWSEVLVVLQGLGYRKAPKPAPDPRERLDRGGCAIPRADRSAPGIGA
jgi:hypothetical protein